MEPSWNLSFLLFFTGLSFEVAAILLLFSIVRAPVYLARSAIGLILIAFALQLSTLFVPEWPISSYWFVLGASPLLLPALLLSQAKRGATAFEPERAPASSNQTAREAFSEQLKRVQEVLGDHPQGLTLVEIGGRLGVEWRRLTGVVKELLERGEIRKEGKRYFSNRRG